ncbi:hypothetical protein [Phaeobacter inhibens]|uniref:hypothetical protein n=1 Tax=Phaeobacter inhibens TaxID=221822 RepID=UPI0021A2E0BE|nr:hypothetical protein [Phaeobacter inhibens]UWR61344.1 hypothetical protein K4F88_03115 [Phaeobacter inhibens]
MNDMTFDHTQHPTAPSSTAPSPVRPSETRNQANATKALLAILLYVLLWGLAVAIWGLPALFLPAVAKTAVMFVILVSITRD